MSDQAAFNAIDLKAEVRKKKKLDRETYELNRAKLCDTVQKDLLKLEAAEHRRRRALPDTIDSKYTENPGWHFYDEAEWQKIWEKEYEFRDGTIKLEDLKLESPLRGRTRQLRDMKTTVAKVFKGLDDTIHEWNVLVDSFEKDKSNLENDEKWYRIRTALHAALNDGSGVGNAGTKVTPADVLKKLDMKVPAAPRSDKSPHSPSSSHAPDHHHSEQTKSSSSTHPHDARNSYDHVLDHEKKHPAHAQGHSPTATTAPHHDPTSRSSSPAASSHSRHNSRGHRALERIHKAFKPHKRSPSSSHSQHSPREHHHVHERIAGHFRSMLGRSGSHKHHAGSSSQSLGESHRVPLRYSVIYPST